MRLNAPVFWTVRACGTVYCHKVALLLVGIETRPCCIPRYFVADFSVYS